MEYRNRHTWSAAAIAAALALTPVSVVAGEAGESCSRTVHEQASADGGSVRVSKTVCANGTVRTAEHHYDANRRLLAMREHEITADGAVRLVAESGRIPAAPAASHAKPPPAKPRTATPDGPESEHTQAWLNAKFKEWRAAAEAQQADHTSNR